MTGTDSDQQHPAEEPRKALDADFYRALAFATQSAATDAPRSDS